MAQIVWGIRVKVWGGGVNVCVVFYLYIVDTPVGGGGWGGGVV